jgi:tetratricopeptide (TPR) repeat protein
MAAPPTDPRKRAPATPPAPPAARRPSGSRYDPTGIDDGQGGIPVGEGRPALRATAWLALLAVIVAIAWLGWRQLERNAVDRAYADGVQALAAGRTDDARMMFDKVIEKRPEWAAAYRQRGYAHVDADKSIPDFTRAIELDANDADAYAARGRAWVAARQPAKGVSDLTRALELGGRHGVAPTTIMAWRADRGVARVEAGDAKGAVDDLSVAAQVRDTAADHHRLAGALAASGDHAGARAAYDKAILGGNQPLWLGERALVLIQLGDDAAAGVDLVRCAQQDPACADTFGVRAGQLARDLGRTPPAGAR